MKKIKDNKGFSLIELIIVIAIMAVLVAVIAPTLTQYLSKSKTKTDKSNANEICGQLQNAITDYEAEGKILIASTATTNVTLTWSASGLNVTNDPGQNDESKTFTQVVNGIITSKPKSKENGNYATATISKGTASGSYNIEVTVGTQKASNQS